MLSIAWSDRCSRPEVRHHYSIPTDRFPLRSHELGVGTLPVLLECSFDCFTVGGVIEYLLPSFSCALMLRAVALGKNDGYYSVRNTTAAARCQIKPLNSKVHTPLEGITP
jgi:hypothetical protein